MREVQHQPRFGHGHHAGRSPRFRQLGKSERRYERAEADRFRRLGYTDLIARDKVNIDVFRLKDDTPDDPDLLPPPDEIAAEIVENLEAALDRFRKASPSLQPAGTR
jgi:type I restriction enzyme M protein